MQRMKSILQKNEKFKVVIVTHTKKEYEILRDILTELRFTHSILPDPLENLMNAHVKEIGYRCCWRISDYMGVCWNDIKNLDRSINYWKQYCSDIIEINKEGNLVFIE